jgi:hypothetical protein
MLDGNFTLHDDPWALFGRSPEFADSLAGHSHFPVFVGRAATALLVGSEERYTEA